MTRSELQAAINTRVANKLPAIRTRQQAYRENHGRHWQGLLTCSAVPADGNQGPQDRLAICAGGHTRSWLDAMQETDALAVCALQMSEYLGPQGAGWELHAVVRWSGQTWRRVWHEGPETRRATGWERVE